MTVTTAHASRPRGYDDLPALIALMTGDEKHDAAATSTLDVLWVLYDQVLDVDPAHPEDPGRDRFLLSKGHGPMAYYAVLAAKGFVPADWLADWASFDSALGHHPDRVLVPGVEIGSGSLGHGLPLAVGVALGLRAQRNPAQVFVLVGDAELDEGSNQEAREMASALGLDNLTVVVVDNRSASYAAPGRIAARFVTEDWSVTTVDGRDHAALAAALTPRTRPALPAGARPAPGRPGRRSARSSGRPRAVVAVVA